METELSLAAEVLLLNIDPADRGLLCATRRRLRQALSAATDAAGRGGRTRSRRFGVVRTAHRELTDAGLVEGSRSVRNVTLRDRASATTRFSQLWRAIDRGDLSRRRDRDLLVLLAASGALARWLSTHQRSVAARRLREVVLEGDGSATSSSVAALERTGLKPRELLANFGLRDAGGTMKGFDPGHHADGRPDKAMFP